jgi:uncharacterized membrane protein YjgN (DUF898 family)
MLQGRHPYTKYSYAPIYRGVRCFWGFITIRQAGIRFALENLYPTGAFMSNGSGSTNAKLILVLGILSIACFPILGPVAWIMGNNALKKLDQGFGDPNTRGQVVDGRILGIIGTVLWVLSCIYVVLMFIFLGVMAAIQGQP